MQQNKFLFLKEVFFFKVLKRALFKKRFLIDTVKIDKHLNLTALTINTFFRYSRKSYISRLKNKKRINKKIFSAIFFKSLKLFKIAHIKIKSLNRKINLKNIKTFSRCLQQYKNSIFVRRLDLYSDFIKLNALIIEKKITPASYLFLISQIFTVLLKKKHSQFMFFIKGIFKQLLKTKGTKIKGIKF